MRHGDSRTDRVVITGGLGFIGSHLSRVLSRRGSHVLIIDDGSSGRAVPHDLVGRDRVKIEHASVLNRSALSTLLHGSLVFHLASVVGVERVLRNPHHAYRVAADGSRNVLEICAQRGIPCVLFSTSEVYGPDRECALAESLPPAEVPAADARFSYAAGKISAESLAHELGARAGLQVMVVRPFNIAGPGQDPASGMVLARFCDRALRGLPLPIHGDGRQTRCFLHVADLVQWVLQLIDLDGVYGKTINVGSDAEISIGELADRIISLSASSSRVMMVPYPAAFGPAFRDFRRRRPDLTLLRSLLCSAAPRALDAIVGEALDAMRSTCKPGLLPVR